MPAPTLEMRQVLDFLAEQKRGKPSRYSIPFEDARRALAEERKWWIETAPRMARIDRETMKVGDRQVELQSAVPEEADDSVEIIYLHGGGWCVGSFDTHAAIVQGFAQACRHTVTNLDYSLAPEHPFPAASEDLRQVFAELRRRRPPTTRWVLAGDSAGANLALLEAMRAREAGELLPDALVLLYGVYLPQRPSHSMLTLGDGSWGLSLQAMARYEKHYLAGREGDAVPSSFPLFHSLRNLPPMYIGAAELDPLHDDSIRLHDAVRDYGGRSTLALYRGAVHGFLTYGRMMKAPSEAFADIARFLDSITTP
jgi:acetyl esterase